MIRDETRRAARVSTAAVVAIALLTALAMTFMMPGEAHALKATGGAKMYRIQLEEKSVDTFLWSSGSEEHYESKIYAEGVSRSFDITGDGKPDVVKVTVEDESSPVSDYRVTVYVNNQRALKIPKDGATVLDAWSWGYEENISCDKGKENFPCYIVKLKNGKLFFSMQNNLYVYKGGKLKNVVNYKQMLGGGERYGDMKTGYVEKISGNNIYVRAEMNSLSLFFMQVQFKCAYKKGTFKPVSTTGELWVRMLRKNGSTPFVKAPTLKTRKAVTVYKNAKCTSKKFTVKKGKKIKLTKVYIKGTAMSVKVKSGGKTGWIKMAKTGKSKDLNNGWPPFKNLPYIFYNWPS
ncbi:hypothetical protein AALA69_02685 [Eggerthellaceae bacterium 24-137]